MGPGDAIARIREICLALPGAVEKSFGGHLAPSFRVGEKLFVMTSEDGTKMTCKAPPGVQPVLVASDPDRFYVPPYVGHKGWIGISLEVDHDWDEIAEIIEDSWRMTAPKRLQAQFDRDRRRES